MPIEIVVTSGRLNRDPESRDFIDYVRKNDAKLGLDRAVLYYDFPAYTDYETASHRPDILIFSPAHDFVAIRFWGETLFGRTEELTDTDKSLGDFCSNLYARLLRSRELRKSRTKSLVDVHPIIFLDASVEKKRPKDDDEIDSEICTNFSKFSELVGRLAHPALEASLCSEIRSIVEGAKALARPIKRTIEDPAKQPLAVAMSALEAEIANFDQKQRHVALVEVGGPARIRGLAGSGKTVILAMKAAHLHLNNPEDRILVTFYTKSLRATLKMLITKFYRHFSENDPDWTKIHIRHGWGGASIPGVYSDTCKRQGIAPLRLDEARRLAKGAGDAFGAVCGDLLQKVKVSAHYDHVLIDEGQDFPGSFYELCFELARGDRDKKSIVWAYDELQNILNVQMRTPEELFGTDKDGKPRISLDRSLPNLPPGATNDVVLSKCYRNQRDVLVVAHALGFGVYGEIVQLLESAEHWQDVGYDVLSGALQTGNEVRVVRPKENSPVDVAATKDFPLIDWEAHSDLNDEVGWIVAGIQSFIENGLAPEEIIVISLDDRHARAYLNRISEQLSLVGIASNNIIADPYNEPPFAIPGKVTLTTVYRAKGNEAAAVFAAGIDAVETKTRDGRNKIFTAFTRSKSWLRISGVSSAARKVFREVKIAVDLAPEIKFVMPDLKKIETIQRDLSKKQTRAKAAREEYIRKLRAAGYSDDEIEEELSMSVKSE